ncbi:uncharacterized protein BO80DRAFT_149632 [Aspergillus ibericus CBS 121593]|uniref:Uncharacterized protein n=1 Tax=Aspergillus ibericus CBS 121593 TaxID=1448316 RepID=A0A395GW60_9EURO|nr:hypothetical protein BO80DRAFT_149632 [Aspergillus ibericus CBS 121593]RAK98927.1 hypothetical protein BO80DRAFT_149632 [Aspergillus ibericus CBS 121593]
MREGGSLQILFAFFSFFIFTNVFYFFLLHTYYVFPSPISLLLHPAPGRLVLAAVLVGKSAPRRRYSLLRPGGSGVKPKGKLRHLPFPCPGSRKASDDTGVP